MKNKELEFLKRKLDRLDIKVRFEKSAKKIIYNKIENKNSTKISLKGIFWKKDNWLNYKVIRIEESYSSDEIKDIKEIKLALLCKILEKGIKIFF